MGRNCCGAGRGAVGVGTGDPERGSGCRVRVGVVERGGVLERLWRGVPPIGEGKSRVCSGCAGVLTVGVEIRLTYCQRSWGCLFAAAVRVGDVVLGMLAVVFEEVDWSVCGVAGMHANAG